jgi:hypothetical protein
MVGWVPGREEDHVIAVAKRHELQAPKPDHRGQWKWTFGVCHPKKWWESDVGMQRPPTWRANCRCSDLGGALDRRVNLCCVLPNPDGDARRIHGGFILVRAKKALHPVRGERVLYFLAPRCFRRGYKLGEREPVLSLKERV